MPVLQYRPEIDGLRAIAVLAVMLCHMNPVILPGGFIGVDVFFVISGYLITGIISRQIFKNDFSFRDFYVRRMRRILPVYFLVIFMTLAVGLVLLAPDDLKALFSSIISSLCFLANVYFSTRNGYFDISSDQKPLLHMWSLSVEEQYYLLWPLLLFVAWKIIQRQPFVKNKSRILNLVLLTVAASFLALSQYITSHPRVGVDGYYLIQSRAVELFIGSIAALVPIKKALHPTIYASAGIIAVFASFVVIDKNTAFPGINALAPCIGTACILYFSTNERSSLYSVKRILSTPILVNIGLLSYSMYLWHWPILAYARYIYNEPSLPAPLLLACFVGTLILSLFSYHLVEKRGKKINFHFLKTALYTYLAPGFATLFFVLIINYEYIRPNSALITYGLDVCHGNFSKHCIRGDRNSPKPNILMIGDSHAAQYNSFMDVIGKKEKWSAMVVTAGACSPVFGYTEKVLPLWAQKPCRNLKNYFFNNYKNYRYIFLATRWAYQLGLSNGVPSAPINYDVDYFEKLKNTLTTISKSRKVFVFSDTPRLRTKPFLIIRLHELGINTEQGYDTDYLQANEIIKKLVESIPNAYWIDTEKYIEHMKHGFLFDGNTVYMDTEHLNMFGSKTLGLLFSQKETIIR